MNEFSPGVVPELAPLLDILVKRDGNRTAAIQDIIRLAPSIAASPADQPEKRANNVVIGLSKCGILEPLRNDRDRSIYRVSTFGQTLASLPNPAEQYSAFAKHLLTQCHADEILDVVRGLQQNNRPCSKQNINAGLRARGFSLTTNDGNAGKMRQWLEKTGVVDEDWNIDEAKYSELTGAPAAVEEEWRNLAREQVCLLTTLRDLNVGSEPEWQDGAHVKKLCIDRFGHDALPEADLRRKVLVPLEQAGWIATRGERREGGGRGGKIGELRATAKLLAGPTRFALPSRSEQHRRARAKIMNLPLEELDSRLKHGSTHDRGIALEVLAIRLAVMAGLEPDPPRVRNASTGSAEVDLFAEGAHLMFSRWIFQCKNTPNQKLRLEDLAREVGLATLTHANVIVMVTTGRTTSSFRTYASTVEQSLNLQIVLLDRPRLDRIFTGGGTALIDLLMEESKEALRAKRPRLVETLKADWADD